MSLRNWLPCPLGLVLAILLISDPLAGDDWPQWRGPHRNGVWQETGIIDKFAGEQIPLAWRVKVGPGYSGPTVAKGRVYLTDRLVEPEQVERIHCFDEKTGKPVWQVSYSAEYSIGYKAGPRASVTVHEGMALALGAMGHLHCLDAASGTIRWMKDLNQVYKIEMPIWGIAAAPLVVGDAVILHIGGKDACIVALDLDSGEQLWTALSDRASYSSPVMVEQAGRPVVICWTGDSVSGLAPDSGKVHWRHPFPPSRMPIGIATPVVHGPDVFLTSFYDGSMMLRLDQEKLAVSQLWRKVGADERSTIGLHSIISTPIRLKGHLYGVDSYGELRCLDAATGERVWEDQTATPKARWSTIHFVQNKDRVWMFNERGELIIGQLSPQGFVEVSRAKLIEPTLDQLNRRNGVCWAHPAFANRHVLIRNDNELVSASLAKE